MKAAEARWRTDGIFQALCSGLVLILTACSDHSPTNGLTKQTVAGTMSFVLGGTSGSSSLNLAGIERQGGGSVQPTSLMATDEYVVSPRKAKITFTSVTFRGATGEPLGESSLGACTVTYDRSLASGSTLLNCPFTAPVGDIYEIAVDYNKAIEMLVSDAAIGVYTNPSSPTGFSTSAPAGGAIFVPFTILIGGNGTTRTTPIIFPSPISIAAGSTATIYITTDMIHTFQLMVNTGGTTLSPTTRGEGSEAIALFGGPTPGSSRYYSNANTTEGFKAGSVGTIAQGFASLRVFYDQAGTALFLMSPSQSPQCAPEFGPKGAWATPPIAGGIGGWLGTDANKNLAWALPAASNSYSVYAAYFVMAERTVIGQTTVLKCKATASPPAPADGKTYASGAPSMPTPDKSVTLTLLAK